MTIEAAALAEADPHARHALDSAAIVERSNDHSRWQHFFNLVFLRSGVSPSAATEQALDELLVYQRDWNLWEHIPDFVRPALAALRAQGYQLVVVSNANGTLRRTFERLDLAPFVDLVVDSGEEGIEKPDPRIFALALDRAHATAERVVHVGDMYHVDVVGARRAGLSALLVDEAGLKLDLDCPRIQSVAELPELLRRGR